MQIPRPSRAQRDLLHLPILPCDACSYCSSAVDFFLLFSPRQLSPNFNVSKYPNYLRNCEELRILRASRTHEGLLRLPFPLSFRLLFVQWLGWYLPHPPPPNIAECKCKQPNVWKIPGEIRGIANTVTRETPEDFLFCFFNQILILRSGSLPPSTRSCRTLLNFPLPPNATDVRASRGSSVCPDKCADKQSP